MQWLRFERLRWDKGQPDTAAYWCEGCERPIAERYKAQMLPAGRWQPIAAAAAPLTVGYHLSALYAPLGLAELEPDRRLARAGARDRRNPPRLRQRGLCLCPAAHGCVARAALRVVVGGRGTNPRYFSALATEAR